MMWRRFAVAHDIPGSFEQVEEIKTFDFDTLVGGTSRARGRGLMSIYKAHS
jgi:hypothetical protein